MNWNAFNYVNFLTWKQNLLQMNSEKCLDQDEVAQFYLLLNLVCGLGGSYMPSPNQGSYL